jgi:hypothetical protein
MGIGDWLMAIGEAEAMYRSNGMPVAFVKPTTNAVYWDEFLFRGLPFLSKRVGDGVQIIVQGGGVRPYVQYKTDSRWFWRPYKPKPGRISLTDQELSAGRRWAGSVIVEPKLKTSRREWCNRNWGAEKWRALVEELSDLPLLELYETSPSGIVPNVAYTPNIRVAASIVAHCAGVVTHEGGMHHLAAAMRKYAVVIFGGFVGPENTGYDFHINLTGGAQACGSRLPCEHCLEAMRSISVSEVARSVRRILQRPPYEDDTARLVHAR